MTYDEALTQVLALLRREQRVAYRALKRRFALDDEYLEDLKADLIDAKRLAIDEAGKVLVWASREGNGEAENRGSRDLAPTPSTQEAGACFLEAIEIARKQQAKSLELRATVSLAKLWQQQGKQHEAYMMLSEIYNWFTEGFDTKDLQEAKALLEEFTQ